MITWNWNVLVNQSLDGQDRTVDRVSVIGPSSAIQFFRVFGRNQDRNARPIAFVPPNKRRLFVEVPVEEVGFVDLSFDLDEDDRSQVFGDIGNDF